MKIVSFLSYIAAGISVLSLFSITFAEASSGHTQEIAREEINVPAKFKSQFRAQGLFYGLPYKSRYQLSTPPFAGLNVERLSIYRGMISILPNKYLIKKHELFFASKYQIVDGWKARLWDHLLRIEIYKSRFDRQMLIVDDYAGHIRRVLEVSNTSLTLINFTGFYVVFTSGSWIPDSGVPIQAFNVVTGTSIPSRQAPFITGSFPDMGAYPDYILGLSRRYSGKLI